MGNLTAKRHIPKVIIWLTAMITLAGERKAVTELDPTVEYTNFSHLVEKVM